MILSECRPVRNVKEFAVKYMCSKVKTPCGGAENASTGKRKYGKRKYESAGMENASRPYGKCKYNANLQSDKKGLVLHKF